MSGRDSRLRRELPDKLSLEEFERRVKEAEGDPERITRLVNVLALSVIEEVREHAAAREAAESTGSREGDREE